MSNLGIGILLLTYIPIMVMSGILLANFFASIWSKRGSDKYPETRKAVLILMLAIFFDATLTSIGYVHQLFLDRPLSDWFSAAIPFFMIYRGILLYAIYLFYKLFCCNMKGKKNG